MAKWEYLTCNIDIITGKYLHIDQWYSSWYDLDSLGSDGWELVSVVERPTVAPEVLAASTYLSETKSVGLFKRKKREE